MRIYTRRGDRGETGLLSGERVSKTDPRCEACGTLDEAVSALGLARALSQDPKVQELVKALQRELFTVGAELATEPSQYSRVQKRIATVTPDMVARLEQAIDQLSQQVQIPRAFIIPGASAASAALDLARATVRRAERKTVALQEAGMLANPEVLRYLNRASDLLFVAARYQDRALPVERLTEDGG